MAVSQRARIGLRSVVYAVLNEASDVAGSTPTWGAVTPLAQALELSFDPGSVSASLFADDGQVQSAESVGEMKISFGVSDLLPADVAALLGHTYAAGQIVEKVTDQSPYIALGAKLARAGAVDEYFWLYKVKLSKPKFDAKTKGASVEFQTPMMEGAVCKLTANDAYRLRMRTDDSNALAATLANFFNQPVLPSADVNALLCAISKVSTNMVFTFTKTGGGVVTLTQANLSASTLPVLKGASAAAQAGTYVITNNGTATVTVTFTPSVAFGTAYVSGFCTSDVIDQNSVHATEAGAVITYP